MKFWTTAPEAYDYDYTVDTEVRSGLKLGHIYRLVRIKTRGPHDHGRVQYQTERYLSGLYDCIPFESLQQELP